MDNHVLDDAGFTLIEILIVIVVLGVLSVVVAASVGGIVGGAEESACKTDGHTLATAAEAFFAQREVSLIPDAGGADGYERTLVEEGFLRSTSTYYDLDAAGQLILVGPPCD